MMERLRPVFGHECVADGSRASVVDGFGQSKFENLGLKTSLKEIFNFQTEDVIELHFVLFENTDSDQSTEESITFEKTFWVFFFQCQKSTGNFSYFGDGQFDSPDFTLVSEAKLAVQFQFLVQSSFFVTSGWSDKGLRLNERPCPM